MSGPAVDAVPRRGVTSKRVLSYLMEVILPSYASIKGIQEYAQKKISKRIKEVGWTPEDVKKNIGQGLERVLGGEVPFTSASAHFMALESKMKLPIYDLLPIKKRLPKAKYKEVFRNITGQDCDGHMTAEENLYYMLIEHGIDRPFRED